MIREANPEPNDDRWMREALRLAEQAAKADEIPVGAVVVSEDEVVLGRGFNCPIGSMDPTAHAEVLALRDAALRVGNYRLPRVSLFVTVEPCLMCLGAIVHARVARVVFGCAEPKSGALGSVVGLDSIRLNHTVSMVSGVCAKEASLLLQAFFRVRRGA